jgi:LuxR family maltose regulon positive regulatory protein
MIQFAQQALCALPERELAWRGGVAVVLGNALTHQGRVREAADAFEEARIAGRSTHNGFLVLTASVHAAINHIYRGQLARALSICREQLADEDLSRLPAAGTLHALQGDILRERNDLAGARRQVERGSVLCERGGAVAMLGWSHLARLRLCFSEQDWAGVEQSAQALDGLSQAPSWVPVAATAWRARAWLAQERVELAAHLLAERALAVGDTLSFLYLEEYLALTRLWLVQGVEQPRGDGLADALNLLYRLTEACEAGGWTHTLIQALVLLARAHILAGESESSLIALNRALVLAEPEGYVRTFLDEGPAVIELLSRVAWRRDLSGYARKVVSLASVSLGQPVPAFDPLTERELEVLALLAEGLTNREIGERLVITTGTAKVHVSNVYRKLGVRGRIQAAAWGKKLGLF